MTTVLATKVYLSNNAFDHDLNITSVNCNNVEWTNNSMYNAFNGCSNLREVRDINENVESMVCAFTGTNISSVPTLPKSATTLHSYCWGCNSLTSVPNDYPVNVSSMYAAYFRCGNITDVSNVKFNNPKLLSALCFGDCPNLVSIPSNISVSNSWNMFNNCAKLNFSTLNISSNDMGGMFSLCPTLKNITVNINTPQNITYGYATGMFHNCSNLYSVNILFDQNCQLTSATSVFSNCINLSIVNIPTIPNNLRYIDFLFNNCSNLYYVSPLNLYNSNITSMAGTFNNCSNLAINSETLTLPSNLIYMNQIFRRCSLLENAPTIPNSVVNMSWAFDTCNNLTSVSDIPESVTSIDGTFRFCQKLTAIPNIRTTNLINISNAFYYSGINSLASDPSSTVINFENQVNLTNVYGAFYNIGNKFNEIRLGATEICNAVSFAKTVDNSQINVYIPFSYSTSGNHRTICYKYNNASSPNNGMKMYSVIDAPNVYGTEMVNCSRLSNTIFYLNNGNYEYVTPSLFRYRYSPGASGGYFIQLVYNTPPFQNGYYYRDETNDIFTPYEEGDATPTYNAFVSAGYDINGTKDNVYLKDILPGGVDVNVSNYRYELSGSSVILTEYIGDEEEIDMPNV